MATPSRTSQRVRFGEFELDLSTRELWANGSRQTLAPQPFQVLQLLIEHRGDLVTRDMLVARLWPSDTFVDYEQGLKKAIGRLRENLNDSAEKPRFIENLPRQGYRFIAEMDFQGPAQTHASRPLVLLPHLAEGEAATGATERKLIAYWYLVAAFLVVIACVAGILYWRSRGSRRELSSHEPKLTQLTANSYENPIVSSAISPDGKYIAFTDTANKIRIRLLATGETQTIAEPESPPGSSQEWVIAAWFPDSTRFIVNARPPNSYSAIPTRFQLFIRSQPGAAEAASKSSVWMISVLGRTAQKLRDDADAFSVSPDGSLIAFGTDSAELGDREIWLMDSKGLQASKLYEAPANTTIGGLNWFRDGLRVVYFQVSASGGELVSRDLRGGPAIPLVQYSGWWGVTDFVLLADGRMIYAREGNLWELQIDALSGKSLAKARQLTNWSGVWVGEMSATGDGKQLAFQRWTSQTTVSVADIEANGVHISPPRHLTLSEHTNAADTWTPDSTALIFRSVRNGHQGLFKQTLDSDTEQPLVMGAKEVGGAAISPNGSWLFYLDCGPDMKVGCDQVTPLMRIPIHGGEPHEVLKSNTYGRPRCTVSPANLCVIAEQSDDGKPLVFTSFDAVKGRGAEIARFETEAGDPEYNWAISPDGSAIAILKLWDNKIHIVPLKGQPQQVVTVKHPINLAGLYWAADGRGWFSMNRDKAGATLQFVDLHGEVHPLLQLSGYSVAYGIPSPDGRHLAIVGTARSSNVWLMEDF
jgi:DNA-binding winged helix-turn-helix (wHTH) protein/Tol biopolymer transport system component